MVIDMETLSSYPWIREGWRIRSADGSIIARTQPWDESGCRQEDQANVNVMTASPNLYQELKYAVECVGNGCSPGEEWLERAKIAVSLAEGISI